MNVDLHCHTFPDAYVSLLRREGSVQDVTFVPGERGAEQLLVDGGKQTLTLTARMCSPESLLAAMDEARLDVAALSPASNMYHYGADASMARRLARAINEGFASLSAESPARLKFFATVPMPHPGWALSELDYAMRELGAVGIAIATNVQGANLDTPDFWTVFERVHEYDIPLFIHPAHVAGADRLSRYFLSNLIGNPVDTSIAVASLIFGRAELEGHDIPDFHAPRRRPLRRHAAVGIRHGGDREIMDVVGGRPRLRRSAAAQFHGGR